MRILHICMCAFSRSRRHYDQSYIEHRSLFAQTVRPLRHLV